MAIQASDDTALERKLQAILELYFGYNVFRPRQLEAIKATLAGIDVLLILPTGGGKSLTFQLPPLVTHQVTIVVTPLLALAYDQVQGLLHSSEVAAVSWTSNTSESQKDSISRDVVSPDGSYQLLYTTPESLGTERLLTVLQEAHAAGKLCSLAIDEAHACVEWGHDFRPSYLKLGELRRRLPGLPCIAVTATATPDVRCHILTTLCMENPLTLVSSFNRPELQFSVAYKETIGDGSETAVKASLVSFIHHRPATTGIVYCRKRSTCDEVAKALQDADIDAAAYHAGLDGSRRTKVQREWKEGGLDVIVATISFGMGVDMRTVRWVVHVDPPASLEGFYQEAGRAGRDGQRAESLMYVSDEDLRKAAKMERGFRSGATTAVAEYAQAPACRRQVLLRHFHEKRGPCSAEAGEELCDYCADPRKVRAGLAGVEAKLQQARRACDGATACEGMEDGTAADPYDTVDPGSDGEAALESVEKQGCGTATGAPASQAAQPLRTVNIVPRQLVKMKARAEAAAGGINIPAPVAQDHGVKSVTVNSPHARHDCTGAESGDRDTDARDVPDDVSVQAVQAAAKRRRRFQAPRALNK